MGKLVLLSVIVGWALSHDWMIHPSLTLVWCQYCCLILLLCTEPLYPRVKYKTISFQTRGALVYMICRFIKQCIPFPSWGYTEGIQHTETVRKTGDEDTYLAGHRDYSHVRAGCCVPQSFWSKQIDELVEGEKMSSSLDFQERWVGKQQPQTAFCRVRLGGRKGEIVENLMRSTLKWSLILVPSWRFFVRNGGVYSLKVQTFCAKRIFNKN